MLSVATSGPSPERQTVAPSGVPFGKPSNGRAPICWSCVSHETQPLAAIIERKRSVEVFSHVASTADGGVKVGLGVADAVDDGSALGAVLTVGVGSGVASDALGARATTIRTMITTIPTAAPAMAHRRLVDTSRGYLRIKLLPDRTRVAVEWRACGIRCSL